VGGENVAPMEVEAVLAAHPGVMTVAVVGVPERLPRDHGHLAMLDASMAYLRQFVPDVLAAVRFAGGPGAGELLEAVAVLAGLTRPGRARSRRTPRPGSCRPGGLATWTPRRTQAT
jgi:acyl-CoA synthetase (AMP-forming)/AMP-acid ligase II